MYTILSNDGELQPIVDGLLEVTISINDGHQYHITGQCCFSLQEPIIAIYIK